MNYWLVPLAFLVGGMLLKWLLDLFFLRGHYDELERRLNSREADYSTLKHEHSQALTDLRNRLTELDATAKSKALAEGSLAKGQSDLAALRPHLMRVEEELKAVRVQEAELSSRCTDGERERDASRRTLNSLQTELREARSTAEARGLRGAELEATLATISGASEGLRQEVATLRVEATTTTQRVAELEGELAAQQSVTNTLENAIRGRDAQLADFPARLAALDAERNSVATSLGVADRELALVRAELAQTMPKLELASSTVATRDVDLKALRQQWELAQMALKEAKSQARADAETAVAKEREAAQIRLEQELADGKRSSTAAAAENRRLEGEVAALRRSLATAEQARLVATTPETPDPAAQAELVQRLRDVEAELEIVSQSHAQLELELISARQKAAAPLPPPPSATDAGGPSPAALLAEIDELNRERNTLAAELAALRSNGASDGAPPPVSPRKRKPRAPEVDLFAARAVSAVPPHGPADGPADGPAESEAVRQFSVCCPQHLSDVRGIGSVFEQRLYTAGVGSYWELSQLTDRTLTEVLELDERQREQYDFAATRADANRLAEETKTMGQKWTGEPPDDLELLEGIGPAIEKRLYEAGICTFAALAQTSEELLSEVCPVAKFRDANYASWIEQARQRLSAEEN